MNKDSLILNTQIVQRHMATDFDFRIAHVDHDLTYVDRLLIESQSLVHEIELQLSEFIETSSISNFNAATVSESIKFSSHAMKVLKLALKISASTQFSFNPFSKSKELEIITFEDLIEVNDTLQTVRKLNSKLHLSFGAIGKGYAIDAVAEKLTRAGFDHFLLSAGGSSIALSGFRDMKSAPWLWSWCWKKDLAGELLGVPFEHEKGQPMSIGVSGTLEQGQHIHLNDVHFKSLTSLVAHPSAAVSDALSTALFAGGWDVMKDVTLIHPQLPGLAFIDQSEKPVWNSVFARNWKIPTTWLGVFIAAWMFVGINQYVKADDTSVDFSEEVTNSFNPYVFSRDALWVSLPLGTLLFLGLHLLQSTKKKKRKKVVPEIFSTYKNPQNKTQTKEKV